LIFGRLAIDEADGAILAHTTRLPGRVVKKGTVLDGAAIDALREAGILAVVAARLEPGDVAEDPAAQLIGNALAAAGLTPTRAATGRVNLVAADSGLLLVDAARIHALNAVDDAVTIATLPDAARVAAREMVATIKIIPFAVTGAVLDHAAALAGTGTAMSLHPWRALQAGLVVTELPGLKQSVIDGTVAATQARVEALTGTLLPARRCAHQTAPIAAALAELLAEGADLLLVAGASAVVDRRDVGPAGIVEAGGEILHFGMPVDPGNLICLGRIGAVPALVLPGCARSPKLNGIDWVLERLFAGLPVSGRDIASMGVGGLLKDVSARPLPRAKASRATSGVAAVVLAAGRSSRMAPRNKLLVPDGAGKPMVVRVVDNLLSSGARPVVVVTGHAEPDVRAALAGRPVQFVHATEYAAGLSASLRAGLAALPAAAVAALVVLGDMPLVTGRMVDRLIAAYDSDEGRLIVAPVHGGQPGNPVLWDRRFFPEMAALTGDAGARVLLKRHAEQVAEIEMEEAVLQDFDTPESLGALA